MMHMDVRTGRAAAEVAHGAGPGRSRAALEAEQEALQQAIPVLEAELAAVEEACLAHERQVKELAAEEARIQQRKRELQVQTRQLADQRADVTRRCRELDKRRARLLRTLAAEDRTDAARAQESSLSPAPAKSEAPPMAELVPLADARRSGPRFAVAVDVTLHTDHNFYMGLTENLSEGGLFVATYDDLPAGSELQVTLQLPDAPAIACRGVVRWVRAYSRFTSDLVPGVGVQLVDVDDTARAAIRMFLAQRDPIFFDAA